MVDTTPAGGDFADEFVLGIDDENVATGIQRHAIDQVEPGGAAGAIGAARQAGRAREIGDHPSRADLAQQVVVRIRHVNIALGIHGHAFGAREAGATAGADGAPFHPRAAGQSSDKAAGGDFPNRVVGEIPHVEVAGRIHRDADGLVELGAAARAIHTAGLTGRSGERGDRPGRGDLPDGVVASVGHIEIACGVHGHAARAVETRGGAGAIGTAGDARRTGNSRHGAGGGDFADDVVIRIRDINIAGGIDRRAARAGETGGGAGAVGRARRAGGTAGERGEGERLSVFRDDEGSGGRAFVVGIGDGGDHRVAARNDRDGGAAVVIDRRRQAGGDGGDGGALGRAVVGEDTEVAEEDARRDRSNHERAGGGAEKADAASGRDHRIRAGIGGRSGASIVRESHGQTGRIRRRGGAEASAIKSLVQISQGHDGILSRHREDKRGSANAKCIGGRKGNREGAGGCDGAGNHSGGRVQRQAGRQRIGRVGGGDAAVGDREVEGLPDDGDEGGGTGDRGRRGRRNAEADGVVDGISHVKIALGIDRDGSRGIEQDHGAGSVPASDHPGRSGQGERDRAREDLSDRLIDGFRHVNVSHRIDGDAGGPPEAGGVPDPIRAAPRVPFPRQSFDGSPRSDGANPVIVGIGHINVAGGIDREVQGRVEFGGGASSEAGARLADPAGQVRHHLAGGDSADGVVAGVRDIDVAARIHCDAAGSVEPRGAAGAIGATRQTRAAGERRHHAGGRDHPHRVVAGVGDVNVAGRIHGNRRGRIEKGGAAGSIGTPTLTRATRERGHRAARSDDPDGVVAGVRHVKVPGRVDRQTTGVAEERGAVGSVGAPGLTDGARKRTEGVGRGEVGLRLEPARAGQGQRAEQKNRPGRKRQGEPAPTKDEAERGDRTNDGPKRHEAGRRRERSLGVGTNPTRKMSGGREHFGRRGGGYCRACS